MRQQRRRRKNLQGGLDCGLLIRMHSFLIALIASLLLCIGGLVHAADAGEVDTHDNCAYWASIGECTKNPGYMLTNCKKSCNVNSASDEKPPFNSFYDIVETDIDGNQFKFDVFRGKVVYMINVASYCGYTDENYRMFRELKKYQPEGFVMVLAPCNSFGYQEPGDGLAIKTFAGKQDFKGIILSKADVNGQETRPSFKYLKYATHTRNINWNFEGKYLISRSGEVYTTTNADIEAQVQLLLQASQSPEL